MRGSRDVEVAEIRRGLARGVGDWPPAQTSQRRDVAARRRQDMWSLALDIELTGESSREVQRAEVIASEIDQIGVGVDGVERYRIEVVRRGAIVWLASLERDR